MFTSSIVVKHSKPTSDQLSVDKDTEAYVRLFVEPSDSACLYGRLGLYYRCSSFDKFDFRISSLFGVFTKMGTFLFFVAL